MSHTPPAPERIFRRLPDDDRRPDCLYAGAPLVPRPGRTRACVAWLCVLAGALWCVLPW